MLGCGACICLISGTTRQEKRCCCGTNQHDQQQHACSSCQEYLGVHAEWRIMAISFRRRLSICSTGNHLPRICRSDCTDELLFVAPPSRCFTSAMARQAHSGGVQVRRFTTPTENSQSSAV
jgi:hypothetical protein